MTALSIGNICWAYILSNLRKPFSHIMSVTFGRNNFHLQLFQLFKSCSSSFSKWEQITVQTIWVFFGVLFVLFCLWLCHCCKCIHKKYFRQSNDFINQYTDRRNDLCTGSEEVYNFSWMPPVQLYQELPNPLPLGTMSGGYPRPATQCWGPQSAVKWTVMSWAYFLIHSVSRKH